jgi:glycosyltransferase involved in cell wall biosynthesis
MPCAASRSALVAGIQNLRLCVRQRHHKRIDYLLQEFHTFRQANPELPVWLVIAGGWEKDTDELIAEGKSVLGDRVRFLVRFPRSRIPDLYRSADFFVLPSLFEMMPIALLEAQASGLPSVIHEHPNLTWATGTGGVATDLSITGRLAKNLWQLAADCGRRRALSASARAHCVANFSEPVVIGQILANYERIAARTASKGG